MSEVEYLVTWLTDWSFIFRILQMYVIFKKINLKYDPRYLRNLKQSKNYQLLIILETFRCLRQTKDFIRVGNKTHFFAFEQTDKSSTVTWLTHSRDLIGLFLIDQANSGGSNYKTLVWFALNNFCPTSCCSWHQILELANKKPKSHPEQWFMLTHHFQLDYQQVKQYEHRTGNVGTIHCFSPSWYLLNLQWHDTTLLTFGISLSLFNMLKW